MNKKRKYAYVAMTSTVLVIVLVIIANLIVVSLSDKVNLSLDLTRDKILSFSHETKNVLDSLEMDVDIISLIPTNEINSDTTHLDEVIKRYATSSDRINYKRIDAEKNPGILSRYAVNGKPLTDSYNIIVETERMYSVIPVEDIFKRIVYNNMNYAQSANLWAEQHISSAILKVTKGSNINCYVLTGHGEMYGAEYFTDNILPGSGYDFKPLALPKSDIPEDANMIVIVSPANDYSVDEIAKLEEFMEKGGNIQVFVGAQTPVLTNLFGYLAEWGIEVKEGVVADDDSSNLLSGYGKKSLMPLIPDNEVTSELVYENMSTVFPDSRPLGIVPTGGQGLGAFVSPVATTGDDGYIKKDIFSVYDDFEAGDKKEKANVALMSERVINRETVSRLYVSGSVNFFSDGLHEYNKGFYANLVSYMNEQPSLYIIPKVVIQDNLVINQSTAYLYALVVIVVIPVIIMAVGFIIWIKRRHL